MNINIESFASAFKSYCSVLDFNDVFSWKEKVVCS